MANIFAATTVTPVALQSFSVAVLIELLHPF